MWRENDVNYNEMKSQHERTVLTYLLVVLGFFQLFFKSVLVDRKLWLFKGCTKH